MRYLITGGAGFVGSNLARTLQQREPEADLLIVDDMRTGTFANLSSEGDAGGGGGGGGEGGGGWSYRGDFIARPLGEVDIAELIDGFEPHVVFHQASITDTTVDDEAAMIRDNVEPFEELIAACFASGRRLVWASSAATYGIEAGGAASAERPFKLDDAGHPANVYGFSKWIMENLHRRAQRRDKKFPIVGLRYFNVFGPGEGNKGHMASMIRKLALDMIAGERPRIFADGEQARDHIHVDDVVACTLAAAEPDARPGIYNLGTGVATSFNDVVASINRTLDTDLQPDYIDNPYTFYQSYTCADLTQTRKAFNWTPKIPTAEGIAQYVRSLQEDAR